MDPADPAQVRVALEQQRAMLGRHQSHLDAVTHYLQTLSSCVVELTTTLRASPQGIAPQQPSAPPPPPRPPPAPVREPRLPPSEKSFDQFAGEMKRVFNRSKLDKGIEMGYSISPILFTAAFEIILIGGRPMVRGVRSQSDQRLPALRSYMDDVTTVLQTAACTSRLLKRLE
ncbi:hypothetical protein SKAU_G00031500 [Synaphobranchus kaupii]|uniref:Uncharacterized protein n=1 Tax=Synaphobranchus kaupii TaxID=118154 RepID=A0A9Q1GED7_SYNKA|nr:hypothetical protein SKAU_G00031500 [Synaphobranchus kaupii]